MVLLTEAFVERECSRAQSMKSLTKHIEKNHLAKITHLYMNDKFISAIGDLSVCKSLKVIYLHNNCISKIENLNFATNATHLYLQHNELTKLENLENLRNLTKLCLGHNRVSVVEGLENLQQLVELRVEKQRLATGVSLIFEPRTARALSSRLKLLDVTGNRMTSLRTISCITSLEILEARDNSIEDIDDLTESVANLSMLRELYLQGNPVTRTYGYRENLIANSDSLVILDGKKINGTCREFMKSLKKEKQLRQTRTRTKMTLSDDLTSSLNLPPAFERSVSRAIIQQLPGPKLTLNVTSALAGSQPQIFPAWKSAPSIAGSQSNSRLAPRSFWKGASRSGKRSLRLSVSIDDTSVFPSI